MGKTCVAQMKLLRRDKHLQLSDIGRENGVLEFDTRSVKIIISILLL